MNEFLNEGFSWGRFVIDALFMTGVLYYSRYTQRRDDRKARERAQARRLAEALARATVRRPNDGA